jgi:hypothetical protein
VPGEIGATGARGITGATGATGVQGLQGATGPIFIGTGIIQVTPANIASGTLTVSANSLGGTLNISPGAFWANAAFLASFEGSFTFDPETEKLNNQYIHSELTKMVQHYLGFNDGQAPNPALITLIQQIVEEYLGE